MLCGLTVLELRVWVRSSFESSGLGFCLKPASAKARDGVRERSSGFPRRGHFVMKVILGNAHIYIYIYKISSTYVQLLRALGYGVSDVFR